MEIHAFDKIVEKVEVLMEIKEKYKLKFDSNSCKNEYTPKLKYHTCEGTYSISPEKVEILTNRKFDSVCYAIALLDLVMPRYFLFNGDKQSYLEDNIPLALFCAEKIANQCKKRYPCQSFSLNLDQIATSFLYELDSLNVYGFKVTRAMKDRMVKFMAMPEFLPVLEKELNERGMTIEKIKRLNLNGKETEIVGQCRSINLTVQQIKTLHNSL